MQTKKDVGGRAVELTFVRRPRFEQPGEEIVSEVLEDGEAVLRVAGDHLGADKPCSRSHSATATKASTRPAARRASAFQPSAARSSGVASGGQTGLSSAAA